jgi:hypothetical protein
MDVMIKAENFLNNQTYTRLDKLFHDAENWNDEDTIGAALAIVVHTAYYLGEIGQALCTLK